MMSRRIFQNEKPLRYSHIRMGRRAPKTEPPAWLLAETPPEAGIRHLQWVLYRQVDAYPTGPKGLAADMDVAEGVISNWKLARRGVNMSPDHVVRLARLLKLSTDELLGVEPLPSINVVALDSGLGRVEAAAVQLAEELRTLRASAAQAAREPSVSRR